MPEPVLPARAAYIAVMAALAKQLLVTHAPMFAGWLATRNLIAGDYP